MTTRLVFHPITEEQWQTVHGMHGSVYFILDRDNDRMKIGHSKNPWKRLRQLQTGSSAKLELVGIIAASPDIEKRLHFEQREVNHHLEWFADGQAGLRWLLAQTDNQPMCRVWARLMPAREIQVWWQWDAEHKTHLKHVYDDGKQAWVGPLMFSGTPNARPGWDATVTEIAPA